MYSVNFTDLPRITVKKRARVLKIFSESSESSIFKFDSSPMPIATIILLSSFHQTLAKDEHTDLHRLWSSRLSSHNRPEGSTLAAISSVWTTSRWEKSLEIISCFTLIFLCLVFLHKRWVVKPSCPLAVLQRTIPKPKSPPLTVFDHRGARSPYFVSSPWGKALYFVLSPSPSSCTCLSPIPSP